MEKAESPRRTRRKARLDEIIQEAGSAADLARAIGTPKSHISAMVAGRRGVGDDMAAKIERHYGKPEGWFDSATSTPPDYKQKHPLAHEQQAQPAINNSSSLTGALATLQDALRKADPLDRASCKPYMAAMFDDPDRVDLVHRIVCALDPPAHKAEPETGALLRTA